MNLAILYYNIDILCFNVEAIFIIRIAFEIIKLELFRNLTILSAKKSKK